MRHAHSHTTAPPTSLWQQDWPQAIAMHGAKNYFLIYDGRQQSLPVSPQRLSHAQAQALIDGRACDQLVFLLPPEREGDVRLITLNRDGSEAELCGNGARCVAALLLDGKPEGKAASLAIETDGGMVQAWREGEDCWIALQAGEIHRGVALAGLPSILANWHGVDMGNPHAVFLLPHNEEARAMAQQWGMWGKKIAAHSQFRACFPQGANISFLRIESAKQLAMRTFERGAGLTQACGSGAAAGFFIAATEKLCHSEAVVRMPGGFLPVRLEEARRIALSGPVVFLPS